MSEILTSPTLSVDEWTKLNPGDEVSIQRAGEFPNTGQIDDITKDAEIFWVHLYDGGGRILVEKHDNVIVKRLLRAPCAAPVANRSS